MAIVGNFRLGGDIIQTIVDRENTLFRDTSSGTTTTIAGLKFDQAGVIKEHPNLKDDVDWKEKAIERLREHLKTFKTENRKINYIRDELVKHGYTPLFKQSDGFRRSKL